MSVSVLIELVETEGFGGGGMVAPTFGEAKALALKALAREVLADTAGRMDVSLDAADVLLSGPPGVHITAGGRQAPGPPGERKVSLTIKALSWS
jgi:hypothetical protein